MIGRMLGAARLRADTFEDVEADRGATIQALLVVVIVDSLVKSLCRPN